MPNLCTSGQEVSGEVSERTKAMRAKWVEETRSRLAGGDDYSTVQQQKERKRIKKDEKDVILGELGLTPNIPDGAGLILKSSLSFLWNKLRSLKRENKLTTHDGYIPNDQIWVKVGGDKGGGSMKSVFEICNVEFPNSVKNTVVWNLFAAADSEVNLRTAMRVNKGHVYQLDGHKWKQKTFAYSSTQYQGQPSRFAQS
ncbi:uncharacterized protein [Ptychodera flava]|uniref:uncharacterized protein isoform X3 n=1 Tax=Ptychodera flava TaxID=63121 RepID=UPI003969DDED